MLPADRVDEANPILEDFHHDHSASISVTGGMAVSAGTVVIVGRAAGRSGWLGNIRKGPQVFLRGESVGPKIEDGGVGWRRDKKEKNVNPVLKEEQVSKRIGKERHLSKSIHGVRLEREWATIFSFLAKHKIPSTTPFATRSVRLVRNSRSRLRKPVSMIAAIVVGSISWKE